jgi:double zinc ribbon protein
MATPVPFTDNYTDHSTEAGYQFEFFCERCGNGYKSAFNASAAGIGGKVLRGLGGLLGGKLANASYGADQMRDLTGSQAKDKALQEAVQEISPLFNQCHKCGQWVCTQICWNEEVGLCVNDAPKLEQEIAGMQAQAQLQQVQEKISQTDYSSGVNVERRQVALCPNCNAEASPSGKFCDSCGAPLAGVPVVCGKCGTDNKRGTKFCAECGNKLA